MTITAAELAVAFAVDTTVVERALDTVGQKLDDTATRARSAAGLALTAFGGAVGATFAGAIKTAASFEQQIANIAAVGGEDAQRNMEAIKQTALELGAATVFSPDEAAAGMEEMIKAGMSVKDVLGGAAQAALDLSAASGTPVAESAEIMSTALNVFSDTMTGFSTEAEKATHVADLLLQAANASATDVHDLGYSFKQVSSIARQFGMSVEDTTTVLAELAQNGIKGESAGTSLKSMLLSVTSMSKPAKEALSAFGMTVADLQDETGQFIGVEALFDKLRAGAEAAGMSAMDINDALSGIFGSEGGRAASIFFRTNADGWAEMRDAMNNAGTASSTAKTRLDTFQGAMEALRGSVQTLVIGLGDAFLPILKPLALGMTDFVNAVLALPGPVKTAVAALVGIAGVTATLVGGWMLFGPQLALVAQGLLAVAPLLLGVGAVLVAAFVAWKTNFLGFRDTVLAGLDALRERFAAVKAWVADFAAVFQESMGRGENVAQAFWNALRRGLVGALGRDNPFVQLLKNVKQSVVRIVDAFREGGFSRGMEQVGVELKRGAEAAWHLVRDVVWPEFVKWATDTAVPAIGNALGTIADWMQQHVPGWFTRAKSALGNAWAVVTAWATDTAVPALGAALAGIGLWLQQHAPEWFAAAKSALGNAWAVVSTWATETAVPALGTALAGIGTYVQQHAPEWFAQAKSALGNAWAVVTTWATETAVPNLVAALGGIADRFGPTAAALVDNIKATIAAQWPTLLASISTSLVPDLVVKGGELVGGLVKGISDRWPDITAWMQTTGFELLKGVLMLTAAGPAALVSLAGAIIVGIKNGMVRVWQEQLQPWLAATLGWQGWSTFFANAATWLYDIGRAIVEGLWNGVAAKWDDFRSWVLTLPGQLPQWFKDALDIQSPSRVMHDIGLNTMAGFRLGLGSGWDSVDALMRARVKKLPGIDATAALRLPPQPAAAGIAGRRSPATAALAGAVSARRDAPARPTTITVNVNGVADPNAVASLVVNRLSAAMGRVSTGAA